MSKTYENVTLREAEDLLDRAENHGLQCSFEVQTNGLFTVTVTIHSNQEDKKDGDSR